MGESFLLLKISKLILGPDTDAGRAIDGGFGRLVGLCDIVLSRVRVISCRLVVVVIVGWCVGVGSSVYVVLLALSFQARCCVPPLCHTWNITRTRSTAVAFTFPIHMLLRVYSMAGVVRVSPLNPHGSRAEKSFFWEGRTTCEHQNSMLLGDVRSKLCVNPMRLPVGDKLHM